MKSATPCPWKIGDLIEVTGYLCQIRTLIGYVGYVDKLYPEEGRVHLQLIGPKLPLSKEDMLREERDGHPWLLPTSNVANYNQIRRLEDPKEIARVKRYRVVKTKEDEDEKESDSVVDEIMRDIDASIDRDKERKDRLDALAATLPIKWVLPGHIKRGDKQNFPAYRDPKVEEAWTFVQHCAAKNEWTDEERVRWAQGLEIVDQSSFWSPRQECRSLVHELDLDPMKDEHAYALYQPRKHVYAPNDTLRDAVIPLWNKGYEILYIQDMDDENTCHSSWRSNQPKGFLVTYAKRRKLPEAK
jgi:hypothetical protein